MADLAIDAEQLLVDGLYRLAASYRSGATACRWTGRRRRALVLAEAGRLAQDAADIRRGATLPSVQPAASADAWIALGHELGVADAAHDAFLDGYSAARHDAAATDAADADRVPAFLSDHHAVAPDNPAAPVPGPADTTEVSRA